jgi:tetratricopeptide (TPR) repeat protein
MTVGQPIFREDRIVEILEMVYQNLKQGLFTEATDLLSEAMEIDFEHPGVASALKCAAFWKERQERERVITDTYERGELFLSQWKLFQSFTERLGDVPERCTFAIKQYVFSAALNHYLRLSEGEPGGDPEVLLRIGRCYKGIGNYEQAVEFLERANQEGREKAEVLAELADCYSLVNETRAAKLFFREAFFLDPGAVDLSGLESPLIVRLADKVRALGVEEHEVAEWIPVYGVIWGVFNVKREMKPLELGKLKQSIFLMEKEIEGGVDAPAPAAPEPLLLARGPLPVRGRDQGADRGGARAHPRARSPGAQAIRDIGES